MRGNRDVGGTLSEREQRQIQSVYRLAAERVELAVGQSRSLAGIVAAVEDMRTLLVEKIREVPPRFPLACRPRCTYCCCAFVEVPPSEVVAIVDYMRTKMPPRRLNELAEKIVRTDERTRGMTPTERTDSLIPCPLLIEDICAIYPARPLKCRGYSSYSKKACRADWDGSAPNAVSVYRWQHVMADVLVDALDATVAAAGFESMGLDLVAALRIALEDESVIDRWLAGESVFGAAKTAR
ncbi:MAG: hypothetical protein ACYC1C_00800 [Chloroflexota bacterium]